MTVATLDTTVRISAKHPVRNAFAGKSSGNGGAGYYETKGHAVNAFDNALQDYDLSFDRDDCISLPDNEGWKTLRVLNAYDVVVGYARLSWYRMPSGRYEFTGYLS